MGGSLASFGPLAMNSGSSSCSCTARAYRVCADVPIIESNRMLQEIETQRRLPMRHPALAAPDERAVLDVLSDVVVAFTNERQLDPVLDRILGTTLQVVRADAGSIMLLSRERDT